MSPTDTPEKIPLVSAKGISEEPQPADETTRRLYAEVSPSVVMVQPAGTRGSGSGFFVDKEGRILTAYHVVEGSLAGQNVSIRSQDGKQYEARIERVSPAHDLALLRLVDAITPAVPALPLADTSELADRAKIFALGHPEGRRDVYLSSGVFDTVIERSQTRGWTPAQYLPPRFAVQTHIPRAEFFAVRELRSLNTTIKGGQSGGPLVNELGEVVGMNSWSSKTGWYFPTAESMRLLLSQGESPQYQYGTPPDVNDGRLLGRIKGGVALATIATLSIARLKAPHQIAVARSLGGIAGVGASSLTLYDGYRFTQTDNLRDYGQTYVGACQ